MRHESLKARGLGYKLEQIARPGDRVLRVVGCHRSAERDSSPFCNVIQHSLQQRAANIVEIDIDTIGAQRFKLASYCLRPMIDRMVVSQFINEPSALFITSGETDCAGAEVEADGCRAVVRL